MSGLVTGDESRWRLIAVVLLAAMLAGCAAAPAQEMSDARRAVQAATYAGAHLYSADWLEAASSELAQAERAIGSARFDVARQHARVARGLALAARNISLLAVAPERAGNLPGDMRATTAALVDASRRASARGDTAEAARLADQAASVSAEAAATPE